MCNLSQGIYEKGRVDAILGSIKNLMRNTGCTAERAMWMIGLPASEQQLYLSKL